MTRPARPTYTLLDVLQASATAPMPIGHQAHHLAPMYEGLRAIERDGEPSVHDWRCVADAVNMVETLVRQGVASDDTGLLHDAVQALHAAGTRHLASGAALRLDGPGLAAVRAVLEDYRALLQALPHRTMVACHRTTERRLREIQRGQRQAHDVTVMAL